MLAEITAQKEQLSAMPTGGADTEGLWKKFALERNFHSNRLAGNTLTYGGTELLLIHGQVTGTHELREIEEMKGHNLAIKKLRETVRENRPPTEAGLQELNRFLLQDAFWKPSLCPDGQQTRNKIIPGEYKTEANNLRLPDGDILQFTDPGEAPSRMEKLLAWINAELSQPTKHPLEIATEAQHEFFLIHPFGDGNGRMARLLTNYILMFCGYPPLIVRAGKKAAYHATLRQAGADTLEALRDFLAEALDESLDLALKAAQGQSITEESALDKEITSFVSKQKKPPATKAEITRYILMEVFEYRLKPLAKKLAEKIAHFDSLFHSFGARDAFSIETSENLPGIFRKFCRKGEIGELEIVLKWTHYQAPESEPFDLLAELRLSFDEAGYRIESSREGRESGNRLQKKYGARLDDETLEKFATNFQARIFEDLKQEVETHKIS